ncbi:MAG: IS4 family transposase [Armatimonadota bacterium]
MVCSSIERWVEDEYESLILHNKGRERRVKATVATFARKPAGPVTAVAGDHAEATAMYRLLGNEAVDPDDLRAPLRDAALRRLGGEKIVIVPQDTTALNFTTHQATEGLGPLGGGDGTKGYGLFVHSAIAVSESGVPLGLMHQQSWARSHEVGRKHSRKKRPLEDKESFRWVQTARAVQAAVPADTRLIQVADREADFFEMFAEPRREGSFLVVRVHRDRRLKDDERLLWDKVAQLKADRSFEMLVHTSHRTTVRKACLELRFGPMTILPPRNGVHDEDLEPVTLNAIEVREVDPPEGATPILWRLLTDWPVCDAEQALRCVRYYELRWLIERYHYVLKSGCGIEDSQLRSFDRIERLLALLSAVALRLLWMTYSARETPDAPCTVAFSDIEWQVVYRYHTAQDPPDEPPGLRDVVRWVAQMGGFLGRKSDGEPGVKVLWRGLTRLQDIVIGFFLMGGKSV